MWKCIITSGVRTGPDQAVQLVESASLTIGSTSIRPPRTGLNCFETTNWTELNHSKWFLCFFIYHFPQNLILIYLFISHPVQPWWNQKNQLVQRNTVNFNTHRAFSNVNTNIISNFGLVPFDKITTLVNIYKIKKDV